MRTLCSYTFAGGEAWADLLLDMGVKNQLFSYYYMRSTLRHEGKRGAGLLSKMRAAHRLGYRFMLDSGAFTYQAKQATGGLPPPAGYFEEYKRFVMEHGDLFDVIVELDVDGHARHEDGRIVTTQEVDAWTNQLLEQPDLRPRVMPVFHPHRGSSWLKSWLCDTSSSLCGISSSTVRGVPNTIALIRRFGKFSHGFAQTRIKTDLKSTPFDSIDSTTWLRADKYGGTCIFQGDRFIVLDHLHKADRARFRDWYQSWGLDFEKIRKDDLKENRLATIIAWRELSNYLELQWRTKAGGRLPYLYEADCRGEMPQIHPLLTREKKP